MALKRIFILWVLGFAVLATARAELWPFGKEWEPANIFWRSEPMPIDMRRLAILPIATEQNDSILEEGRKNLADILGTELRKTAYFDFVNVSEADLERWSGRGAWKLSDELPETLLDEIRIRTGCDALLFVELSGYRPYAPVSMGWKLTIVDAMEHHIWWSVDETADSGRQDVARGAKRYFKENLSESNNKTIGLSLKSPRRFGQYVLNKLVGTMPPR